MIIRPVLPSDAKELLAIYAPYVADTTITFEYDIPSISEFTNRIKNISKSFPYLVAEENGKILGYAYASTYYARAAYDWFLFTLIKMHVAKKLVANYMIHWRKN